MKNLILSLFAGLSLMLTGCFDTTQEITLNEDGSGSYVNINDMSKIIPLTKNMGLGSSDKMPDKAIDTSFSLATQVDSINGLSAEEKVLMKKGNMHLIVNFDDEKFIYSMDFPFASINEVQKINQLAGKVIAESLKKQMPGDLPMGSDEIPAPSSFDDYFSFEYSNGEIKRILNKEKYAGLSSDEYMKGLQQAGSMGIPITQTYIINLPRPAEKAEGKNVKLSEDKKKVTVKTSIDDLYDNPEKMEFTIKY